jgi:hypothetical protein
MENVRSGGEESEIASALHDDPHSVLVFRTVVADDALL